MCAIMCKNMGDFKDKKENKPSKKLVEVVE